VMVGIGAVLAALKAPKTIKAKGRNVTSAAMAMKDAVKKL